MVHELDFESLRIRTIYDGYYIRNKYDQSYPISLILDLKDGNGLLLGHPINDNQ